MSTEPEAPEPLINPGRKTAEDIAKINAAMEAAHGNTADAADILGIERNRLRALIQSHQGLSARWTVSTETLEGETKINDITAINRVPPKPIALTEREKVAVALTVQDRKLNKSLRKLGFGQSEVEAISSVEEFAGQHFEETLTIMHGGLLKSAMRLMMLAEKIERQYLQDEGLEERDRKWWWDQYFRIIEKLRDMNEQTNKAALTKALIELKKKESEGGGGQNKKIAFQPLSAVQVNVNGAKDVKITQVEPNPSG